MYTRQVIACKTATNQVTSKRTAFRDFKLNKKKRWESKPAVGHSVPQGLATWCGCSPRKFLFDLTDFSKEHHSFTWCSFMLNCICAATNDKRSSPISLIHFCLPWLKWHHQSHVKQLSRTNASAIHLTLVSNSCGGRYLSNASFPTFCCLIAKVGVLASL